MKIGIRREEKNQWEGRVPLIPVDIEELKKYQGVEFVVQPSQIRAIPDHLYELSGAKVQEDLSECPLIMGVKEIPPESFQPEKTYLFFSHTIKGQPQNMPILKRMMELKDTLIDYERIIDSHGRRLVFFGRFAGIAGMIDTLWTYGQRLVWEGVQTPFTNLKQALYYAHLDDVKRVMKRMATQIRRQGLPESITPLVIGIAGYGHVSAGAQEIIDLLPHQEIEPKKLLDFIKSGKYSKHQVYKVIFRERDTVKRSDLKKVFRLRDYYQYPEKFESIFSHYVPYLSLLVNAIYWDERYPKLLTKDDLETLYQVNQPFPLRVIGDISCDVEGAIECNLRCTNPGAPAYVYHPQNRRIKYGVQGEGVVVLAVDNLPCELSYDSSKVFSHVLKKFIPQLEKTDFSQPYSQAKLPPPLKRATILYKGELTPDYQYLQKYV